MVYVAAQQRNYQDAWILEDVFLPFVLVMATFLLVLAPEKDNRIVALLSAWTVLVVSLVPALKYVQPYGTTIDATDHYLMVNSLISTGQVAEGHTYASIPAMHSWLASLGLTGGLRAAEVIKLGLPLTGALMPLLVYWIGRRIDLPANLVKFTVPAVCLAIYPYYLPNGTGFTLVPLMMLLGILVVREYGDLAPGDRLAYTVLAVIGLFQLVFWHSTTPMLVPLFLGIGALAPAVAWLVRRRWRRVSLSTGLLRVALLAAILFLGYRVIEADRVFEVVTARLYDMIVVEEEVGSAVPQRVFEITTLDAAISAWLIHGRFLLMAGATMLGLWVVWRNRARWERHLFFYSFLLLVYILSVLLAAVALASGVAYSRFLALSLIVTPFFAGPALWWLGRGLLTGRLPAQRLTRLVWLGLVVALIGLSLVDFYPYQPLVPKAKALTPDTPDEYVVWLNGANSAYQQRMMEFAQNSSDREARFAVDIVGHRQFLRYFGLDEGSRRGLYKPLHWREPVDPAKVDLFLLHWPGPAGALGERVEYRSTAKLSELRETPGWGVVYDNGESFILWIP
jgi:hypothetical protein